MIQIGKWRRQIVIPNVAECTDTPLAADQIRLPRKKSEGDMPQIALTTGGADVMECWLRKVGIADEEFTVGTGNGKVHFYEGSGSNQSNVTKSFQSGGNFTSATPFWSAQANLMKYSWRACASPSVACSHRAPSAVLVIYVQERRALAGEGEELGSHVSTDFAVSACR